jgi:hypothetical protein
MKLGRRCVRGGQIGVAAILAAAACAGACRHAPPPSLFVPELAPEELEVAAERARDEMTRWTRERDELLQEACDPGELAEHTRRTHQADVDEKRADVTTIFVQGEALFDRNFTRDEGLGNGLGELPPPGLSRVEHRIDLGGPDAISCRECHGRAGDDGHGELHQRAWLDGDGRHLTSAKPRVAPHVAGLGAVQALAAEMTAELASMVASARAVVARSSGPVPLPLRAKGVDFGEVVVQRDGSLDTGHLKGIDADLVVKPFGWKGTQATLRGFVRHALPQHMGIEPLPLPTEPVAARAARPGERPTRERIELMRYLFDLDRDGKAGELHEGQLTSLATYLALLDVPLVLPPRTDAAYAAWERGGALFGAIGCAGCHVAELPLRAARWVERPDDASPGLVLDLISDNQVRPRLGQFDKGRSEIPVALFSDLRRHDMGAGLAERAEGGAGPTVFLTRPLWGVADRTFFLHDGRARSFAQAIRLHGGEAQPSADAYDKLAPEAARELEVFLLSLRRFPQGRISP